MRSGLVLIAGLALVGLIDSAPALAQSEDGEQVYRQVCQACHQPGGVGISGTFPPLAGNPNVADADYVRQVIAEGLQGPITVLGVDYDGVMPAVQGLADAQIDAVIGYLQTLRPSTPATTAPAGPVTGDADQGELLFVGGARFANGGAACFACHGAGPYSNQGAGLGPDLSGAYARLGGEAGLTAWLASPPVAAMQPIYRDQPLSEVEILDVVAFLAETDDAPTGGVDPLLVGGLGGFAVLIGLMAVVVKRPKGTYRDRLRSDR